MSSYSDPEGDAVSLEVDIESMSLFATFIDEQRPKIIFDTDVLDILGTYEASINLRDEHDNIS